MPGQACQEEEEEEEEGVRRKRRSARRKGWRKESLARPTYEPVLAVQGEEPAGPQVEEHLGGEEVRR